MEIDITWTGPYGWPRFEAENNLPPLPKHPGVYLQTAEYRGGYIVYAAGLTRRPFGKRFSEHTREYLRGERNILDLPKLRQGIREKIWQGWGWTPKKRIEFAARQAEIVGAARRELAGFRLFVADVPTDGRMPERLEAAVMGCLYAAPPPFCDVACPGMQLSGRWRSEEPITVRTVCRDTLYGLPPRFDV